MALERFIPKSPDPFIRNSQDFEVAKFGHLNTIIEYINSYVVTDSLQLAGSGPITSTARYITDSLGNASAISISTIGVGIGTTTPTSELHIDGHSGFGASLKITTNKVNSVAYVQMISDYVTGFEQYQYGGPGWGWPNWTTTRAGGTAAAPTAVPSNYGLNEYSFWGHDGTGGGQAYSMMTRTSEAWTTTAHGIYTTFNTVATGSTALVERMRFTGTGNITFNNASDTAKVAIKGSGSTSATTSLLVQNSGGTTTPLKTTDDGTTYVGWDSTGDFNSIFSANGNVSIGRYGNGLSYVKSSGGVKLNNNNFEFNNAMYTGSTALSGTFLYLGGVNDASAIVTLTSTTRGFLPPRMTTTQRDAIATPATGLKVYNTTTNTTDTYDGATWQRFGQQTLIKGVGSTSATTSLLVQNSAGLTALQIRDDRSIDIITNSLGNQGWSQSINFLGSPGELKIANNGGGGFFTSFTFGANELMRLNSALQVGIGTNSPAARTHIKGSGSTSATTSLLVQNSAGTTGLAVLDNGNINLNGTSLNNAFNTGVIYINNNGQGNISLSAVNSQLNYTGNFKFGSNNNTTSAVVQIDSTTKGFLPPRMTTAQKNAIATPAAGLMIYDTDLNKLCVYTTAWETITSV